MKTRLRRARSYARGVVDERAKHATAVAAIVEQVHASFKRARAHEVRGDRAEADRCMVAAFSSRMALRALGELEPEIAWPWDEPE